MTERKTDALIALQETDLQIHRLEERRDERPRQLASVEAKVERARENLEAMQEEIKRVKLEVQKREHLVQEHDEKAAKLQAQSMQAKKNDEYQAFQKEISGVKAEKSRVEDGLLDLYMEVEEKTKLEKVRKEELEVEEKALAEARKRVEKEMAEIDAEIEQCRTRRGEQTSGVNGEVLKLYQRVLKAKDDGLALAAAVKFSTIDVDGLVTQWQCEGCNVELTPQDVNLLLVGREIQNCRSCSRILYMPAEKPASAD